MIFFWEKVLSLFLLENHCSNLGEKFPKLEHSLKYNQCSYNFIIFLQNLKFFTHFILIERKNSRFMSHFLKISKKNIIGKTIIFKVRFFIKNVFTTITRANNIYWKKCGNRFSLSKFMRFCRFKNFLFQHIFTIIY